jgi:single-stranded-DNA-specific exonuclease
VGNYPAAAGESAPDWRAMNAAFPILAGAGADAVFAGPSLPPMRLPASGRRWVLSAADAAAAAGIEAATGAAPEIARLLAARGVTAATAAEFLSPSLKASLPDPSALQDMDRAAGRIAAAIIAGEICGVFGDYDVDGASGAAILKLYFDAVGARLAVYLPDRILEGYGPTIEAFRALKEKGARLILTVDCGAAAHHAIAEAAAEGLDIVVLDHHQMDGPPPNGAYATVNPNRPDDRSGLTLLSAAGVVFMAVVAVNRALRARGFFKARKEPDLKTLLDLVALGLVCDVMPMTGLARVLTAQGLKVLAKEGNPGLKALARKAGMKGAPTAFDLGFLLGPRINAAGRIGHARLAFDLLTTDDAERREALADRLHVMNAERQAIERAVQEEAIALVEARRLYERPVIVAAGEGWHPGVVGIVAGRLKDRYQRPAIVAGVEAGLAKGSARSIAGVDIGAAIRSARASGVLIAGGGHAMAAGLTADAARLGDLDAFLDAALRSDVDRAIAAQRLDIDALLAPTAVSARYARMIEAAGPFGPGNPEPVFALPSMIVASARLVGGAHIACELAGPGGERVRAIAFRAEGERLGAMLTGRGRLHLAGRIKTDDWRGGDAAQFQIVDAAEPAPETA